MATEFDISEVRALALCPNNPSAVLIDHSLLQDNYKDFPEEVSGPILEYENAPIKPFCVCVYPKSVLKAKEVAKTIKIAVVVNFPDGTGNMSDVLSETEKALQDGADEVDLVLNYRAIMRNELSGGSEAQNLVHHVKSVCAEKRAVLKVIIESGELKEPRLIVAATMAAIKGGADFVKTSTGRVPVNAEPTACRIIMSCIAAYRYIKPEVTVGFKPAGGVSTIPEFLTMLKETEGFFGKGWLDDRHFRLGSSRLLGQIQAALKK